MKLGLIPMTTCDCYYCKNNLAWPEEEKALEDIRTGKVKLITTTAEEFIKELEELANDIDKTDE